MSKINISKKDLLVLTADGTMHKVVESILERTRSLGIREIQSEIRDHPFKDPGCRTDGIVFLRTFAQQYHYALLIFDYEGCGETKLTPQQLETSLEKKIRLFWNNSSVIVIAPELENWLWNDSLHVAKELNWPNSYSDLKHWLCKQALWQLGNTKPFNPKDTLEYVLKHTKTPRSSSIYTNVAKKVSYNRCRDRAFLKLKKVLQTWFPSKAQYQ